MGERAAVIQAGKAIASALKGFVSDSESGYIHVFTSVSGHLRVVVGSDRFKGKGPVDRQNLIWDYLKQHVSTEQLVCCHGVHPLDLEEYGAALLRKTSMGSMELFMSGADEHSRDDDA